MSTDALNGMRIVYYLISYINMVIPRIKMYWKLKCPSITGISRMRRFIT